MNKITSTPEYQDLLNWRRSMIEYKFKNNHSKSHSFKMPQLNIAPVCLGNLPLLSIAGDEQRHFDQLCHNLSVMEDITFEQAKQRLIEYNKKHL